MRFVELDGVRTVGTNPPGTCAWDRNQDAMLGNLRHQHPGTSAGHVGGGVEKGLKESCCARYHFIVKVSLRVSSLELDIVGHFYVTVLRWIVDGLVSRLVVCSPSRNCHSSEATSLNSAKLWRAPTPHPSDPRKATFMVALIALRRAECDHIGGAL